MLSAQDYVNGNQQGYYTVKGEIKAIEGLNATKWEDLTDGFVLTVDHPGCEVSLQQGDTKRSRFDLSPGDRIVHGIDNDFLLSALAPNQTTSDKKDPPKEEDPPEEDPPEESPPDDEFGGADDEAPSEQD